VTVYNIKQYKLSEDPAPDPIGDLTAAINAMPDTVGTADVDAVYVATTHNYHFENIMLCLEHGKHVLCEKPMVLTKADAEAVFAKAKEKGLFVMECMWSRFLPAFLKAREWVREGKIGDILSAYYTTGFRADPAGRVCDPKLAGGAMYDIGVYGIEGIQFLIDQKITDIEARMQFKNDVDVTDHIIMQFESCTATMISSVVTPYMENNMVVHGSKGTLYLPNACNLYEITIRYDNGTTESFKTDRYANGFEYQILDAIRCIGEDRIESDIIPHRDTVLCAGIFETALEKAR